MRVLLVVGWKRVLPFVSAMQLWQRLHVWIIASIWAGAAPVICAVPVALHFGKCIINELAQVVSQLFVILCESQS